MRRHADATGPARSSGFTLLELVIAVALLGPLLIVIMNSTNVTNTTLKADDTAAGVAERLYRVTERTAQLTRPCVLSSYQVEANANDVALGNATAVGEWISHTNLEPRRSVRFRSAEGELSMNASEVTDFRVLRFALEAGESENGLDDDGDGLVDEGTLTLTYEGQTVVLATRLERCTFTLDNRLLTIEMQAAEVGPEQRVYRARQSQSVYMRNN